MLREYVALCQNLLLQISYSEGSKYIHIDTYRKYPRKYPLALVSSFGKGPHVFSNCHPRAYYAHACRLHCLQGMVVRNGQQRLHFDSV